ncbi:putative krueppel c2h2-type zinc finger protein [Talaromyces proteolyticus]|uniref:Krueppel c2h2-type zinc finger protein n=1 Tax=Talaromyces proteolyticus TaxID=1131652 RepID=A0AAD4KDA0_9EURO|nr:putative krueppel c2h2-type zinc finger protein [Talaromyces proteolyticus]KAH8688775.1 putative krueppel c2h2-type zinc finger protein [Talaromyces proteolyticus]
MRLIEEPIESTYQYLISSADSGADAVTITLEFQPDARGYSCTEPGCGKTFLRAEHLSRHRLNHQPKQIFQCASCPKRFVRKDLLRRHERRHEKGMWFRNSGGFVASNASPMQGSSEAQAQRMLESAAMFTEREQEEDVRMSESATPDVKLMQYEDEDDDEDDEEESEERPDQAPVVYDHAAHIDQMGFQNQNLDATSHSNDMFPPFHEDQVTSLFFDPSITIPDPALDFEWLFDNLSADLNSAGSAGIPSVVSPQSSTSIPGISPLTFGVPSPGHIRKSISSQSSSSSPWAEVRANLLKALNSLAPDILMSSFFYPNNLAGFWDLYFENYHPHFPILHKPTLDPVSASPLLVAAIVTLGSTLSGDGGHFDVANKIHDSLRYIIFGTPDFDPPASLWCVQTLLIIQAHEKMFSTRKHHQLAHIFHGAIITLMKRGVAYQHANLAPGSTATERSWYQWVEMQASNRTAFFGFVMDAQHTFMFGHTCILSVHDVRLPLPCADVLWDCSNPEEWDRMMRKTPESPGFLPILKRLLARTPIPPHCSAFSRLILLHGLFSVTAHLKARDSVTLGVGRSSTANSPRPDAIDTWKETVERAMDTWSFSLVSRSSSLALEASRPLHRMAYVAIYTDINDIHILAGAPSLLGSLLSTNDRLRATARVRAWSQRQESKKALYHCLLLIQETIFTGQLYKASGDNIALRPWSNYHAALILWAYGTMAREKHPLEGKRVSYSAEDYLVRMLMLLKNDADDVDAVAQETSELLQAVRESLEGCRWELLQEAYETLGKLIGNDTK